MQFAGALAIAWLAVRWALNRYKLEKHWERRMSAYTDVLSALGSVNRIQGIWEAQEFDLPVSSIETAEELRKQYWDDRRRLEETIAIARLLLPQSVANAIVELHNHALGGGSVSIPITMALHVNGHGAADLQKLARQAAEQVVSAVTKALDADLNRSSQIMFGGLRYGDA